MKEYAVANGFTIAQEYIDVETTKQSGRTSFGEMVACLKAHPAVRVMLVERIGCEFYDKFAGERLRLEPLRWTEPPIR